MEENLWPPGGTNYVELLDDNAVVDKIAYTLANPVAACCVRRGDAWPGFISRVDDVRGCMYTFERADFFTDDMPDTATLLFGHADLLPELTDDALVQLIRDNLGVTRELDHGYDRGAHSGPRDAVAMTRHWVG